MQDFIKEFDEILVENDAVGAHRLFLSINNFLKVNNSQQNPALYKIKYITGYLAIARLQEDEIIDLLCNHFDIIFEIESYNILENINFLMTRYDDLDERDLFKSKIRNSLRESKLKITTLNISINKSEESPTIENWLKYFRGQFTEVGFTDALNITKFINSDKNFFALSDKDKTKIETLLNLYRKLSISSFDPMGMENDFVIEDSETGEMYYFNKGEFTKLDIEIEDREGVREIEKEKPIVKKVFVPETPIKKEEIAPVVKQNPAEALLREYKDFEKGLSAVSQEVILFGKYKNNLDEFYKEFDEMIKIKQKQKLFAGIIFLVKNNLLNIFIKDNKNLLIEFKNSLLLKYDESTVSNVSNNLDSVELVSLYLQFLFKKFELSPRETGLYGMYLAKTFKSVGQEKYFPIIYGDVNLNQFLFRDIVDVAGKLKLE